MQAERQRQEILKQMIEAARARGLKALSRQTEAGPVIVVGGPKGAIACLVTESGFDVAAWADSIKARLT